MSKIHSYLSWISRIIIGIVFIYSGFVKGVDPLGSAYKFSDYFNAFHANWASSLAFGLSVLQSMIEFALGAAILLNLKPKQSAFGALLFMAFYTPLTFILALTNPVHDCGCFGDALILTNWQTFWKNMVLSIPVVYLFLIRKKQSTKLHCYEQWAGIGTSALFILGISWYATKHLPLLDFRPYKIGTYIPDGMVYPEGAAADVWESKFIYSKEGSSKEFNLKNLPDSSWIFVEAKHTLIKKGYEPPIHDFTITDADGNDVADQLLTSSTYNFLIVAYNLEKTKTDNQDKINQLVEFCHSKDYPVYGLTASTDEVISTFKEKTGALYNFYATDEITLKTMIRANPGIILIKEGTIIANWNANDLPSVEQLNENLLQQSVSNYKKQADKYYIYTLILVSGLLIAIYLLLRPKLFKTKE
jgi:uncharacterized membrane protein YphA (DoxX/SURF4 family)